MKNKVNKNKKGFVLAYASILMAVVMILIAGITSLITVMSQNNQRISDSFKQSLAVDQTFEYFVATLNDSGVDIDGDGAIDENDVISYAEGKELTAVIEEVLQEGVSVAKTLTVHKGEILLLKVTVSTTAETKGKIIYLAYGE